MLCIPVKQNSVKSRSFPGLNQYSAEDKRLKSLKNVEFMVSEAFSIFCFIMSLWKQMSPGTLPIWTLGQVLHGKLHALL